VSLNPEWRAKIEQWRDAIGRMIYVPLASAPFTGFRTHDRFTPGQALKRRSAPMPAGMPWPLAETERKCARTFSAQLALMDQYPEYRFFQSQPHLYRMTQRLYPERYKRIKTAAGRGQWIADGGMWVECDTNISSGEAMIRQFLHGKRFFKEAFGVNSELMWLPDVFGYSGARYVFGLGKNGD